MNFKDGGLVLKFIDMVKDLRFFKQDGKWYADVPNHTLDENEMVMGADSLLDIISDGKDEVTITFGDAYNSNEIIGLEQVSHDEEGAEYVVVNAPYGIADIGQVMWICNVTHDVLGEHPKMLSILRIQ